MGWMFDLRSRYAGFGELDRVEFMGAAGFNRER
jgi:hypothetical protein